MENPFGPQSRGVQAHSVHIPGENTVPQVVQCLFLLNINLPRTQVCGSKMVELAESNFKIPGIRDTECWYSFFLLYPKLDADAALGSRTWTSDSPFLSKFFAYLRRYLHGLCHFLYNQQKQTIFSRLLIAVELKYSIFFFFFGGGGGMLL